MLFKRFTALILSSILAAAAIPAAAAQSYSCNQAAAAVTPNTVIGDCNFDGKLDILDVTALQLFIAKEEIDKDSDANTQGLIYNNMASGNICVVFNNKNENILYWLVTSFSIHGGHLSSKTPLIHRKIRETSSKVEIYYSFVLERKKKIAAMTIHFFKCPGEGYSWDNIDNEINPLNINTINDAIKFAETNNDKEVVEFLNSITK